MQSIVLILILTLFKNVLTTKMYNFVHTKAIISKKNSVFNLNLIELILI
jgi:hypothetical protein